MSESPDKATDRDLDDLQHLIQSCIDSVKGGSELEQKHRAKYERLGDWVRGKRGVKEPAAKKEGKPEPVKEESKSAPTKKAGAKKQTSKSEEDDEGDLV